MGRPPSIPLRQAFVAILCRAGAERGFGPRTAGSARQARQAASPAARIFSSRPTPRHGSSGGQLARSVRRVAEGIVVAPTGGSSSSPLGSRWVPCEPLCPGFKARSSSFGLPIASLAALERRDDMRNPAGPSRGASTSTERRDGARVRGLFACNLALRASHSGRAVPNRRCRRRNPPSSRARFRSRSRTDQLPFSASTRVLPAWCCYLNALDPPDHGCGASR